MDVITVMKVEENNYEDSCSVDPSVSPAEPLEIVTTIDSLVVKSKRKQSLGRRNVEELESSTQEEDTLQTQSSLVHGQDAKTCQYTLCTSDSNELKCYANETSLRNHVDKIHGSTLPFKCQVCSKQFRILSSFQKHSRVHSNQSLKCEICSATFSKRAKLNVHLVRFHKYSSEKLNLKEFPCDMCSNVYYHRYLFERHVVKAHVVDKPHECHVCSKTFIDQAALSKHLKDHDRQSCHVCDVCSKAYKDKKTLLHHLRVVHFRSFRCDKCKKSFSKKFELNAHSNIELEMQYTCQVCNKTFPSQCSHTHHIEIHNATEVQNQHSDLKCEKIKNNCDEFKCELCLKTFDRESYLVAHRKLGHPSSEWPCSKCSKTFRCHYRMKQHERMHAQVKPLKCKLCYKSYCKLSNLRAHENKSHSIKQVFKCKICPKSCGTSGGLSVHETIVHRKRVHLKSQWSNKNSLRNHVDTIHCSAPRFKCKVCFKQFKSASRFKIHSRVHFNQTLPFKCQLCSKNFDGRTHLNLHLVQVHKYSREKLNVKEFPCDMCSKSYYKRSHLEFHVVETHVVDKPHECHVCCKTFIDEVALSKHMESHDRQSIHVCDVCSKAFKNRQGLRFHLRVKHHKFFPCHKCKKSFSSKSEFDAHSDLELQIQYACQICNNAFPSQCSLSAHIGFHESTELVNQDSEKDKTSNNNCVDFKCQLCLKTFDRRAYIDAHRRLAHLNSRWPCSKCSGTFKTHYKMTQHEQTHQEVKPHLKKQEKVSRPRKSFAFICHLCSFETQEDKEVAAHYNSHGLPKITLQRISNFKKQAIMQ